jgi:hypothetical protein
VPVSIPSHCGVSVLAGEWVLINLVLLHQVEHLQVATETDASQLVVVPLVVMDVFDVTVLVSAKSDSVHISACLADEKS